MRIISLIKKETSDEHANLVEIMECKKQFEKICAVMDMLNCHKNVLFSESPVPSVQ